MRKSHKFIVFFLCAILAFSFCGVFAAAQLKLEPSTAHREAALESAQKALDELYEMGLVSVHHVLAPVEDDYLGISYEQIGFYDRIIPECYYVNCATEDGNWININIDKETGKALKCAIDIRMQDGDEKLDKEPLDMGKGEMYYYDSFDRIMREDMTLDEYCTLLNDYWGFDGYTISGSEYDDYNYDTEAPAGSTLIKDLMDEPFVTVFFDGDQKDTPMFIEGMLFPENNHFSFGYSHAVG